jgi:hypothetical protein
MYFIEKPSQVGSRPPFSLGSTSGAKILSAERYNRFQGSLGQ